MIVFLVAFVLREGKFITFFLSSDGLRFLLLDDTQGRPVMFHMCCLLKEDAHDSFVCGIHLLTLLEP